MIALAALLGTGVAAFVGINLLVSLAGRSRTVPLDASRPAQAALVLGAYVHEGGDPSPVLEDRLLTALELYRTGKVGKILVTGDHGEAGYDEVNAMRRFLEARGVPSEDVFMDHAGFDTYDSMYRAREVFAVESLIVVTQRFHLPRAVYIAGRLGLDVQGVEADRRPYLGARWYELREMAARIKAFGEVAFARRPVFLGPVIPITGDGRQTAG